MPCLRVVRLWVEHAVPSIRLCGWLGKSCLGGLAHPTYPLKKPTPRRCCALCLGHPHQTASCPCPEASLAAFGWPQGRLAAKHHACRGPRSAGRGGKTAPLSTQSPHYDSPFPTSPSTKQIHSTHQSDREMRHFSLARAPTGLMATTALLFLLAGTSTTQALDAGDAKNLTRIGYIYTYPIMLSYRQMYADVIAKGPPYNFNQFVIQDKLPDFKVCVCLFLSFPFCLQALSLLPLLFIPLLFCFVILFYSSFANRCFLLPPYTSLHTDGGPQRQRGLPHRHRLDRHPRQPHRPYRARTRPPRSLHVRADHALEGLRDGLCGHAHEVGREGGRERREGKEDRTLKS